MSENNVEALLKRASMLEEEKDYAEALNIYNRILETDPDNEKANERRRAIKNNTLTIVREQFPLLGGGTGVRYYLSVDGERIDSRSFVANMPAETYTVNVTLGKHRLAVWEVGINTFGVNNSAVPKEVLIYDYEITQKEQTVYLRFTKSANLHFTELAQEEGQRSRGCYVATAVYGSYDCPEVWTLRRFRDNTLAETWYGRAFIRTYYAISPTLVKWFGETAWFKNMWKPTLDRMVVRLNGEGVENTPYNDREW